MIFEDSETMHEFMKTVPLAILCIKDIGFAGGLEITKKLLQRTLRRINGLIKRYERFK